MSAPEEEVVTSAAPIGDLSLVDRALTSSSDDQLREAVRQVRPADLGRDFSRRSVVVSRRIFEVLDDRRAGAVLRAAHPAVAAQLLAAVSIERGVKALTFLTADHRAEIIGLLDAELRTKLEDAMTPTDREVVRRILSHGPVAIGRLMTPKVWSAPSDKTVGDALDLLDRDRANIDVAVNHYVIDGGKLVGVIALRDLAVAPRDAKLADIMTRDPISVLEDAPRGDAAEILNTYDFLSLPVVDKEGRLVGVVRVDDVLDTLLDKVGDGFLNQGAVAGKIAGRTPYFQTPLLRTVRSRLTWLVLLFVAETLTGTVLRHFEDSLAKVVALSFFVPLLIGTGGNAGSQTVATVIRASAVGEIRVKDLRRVVFRELSAGVVLGVLLAGIAFGRALLWGVGSELALCVSLTIFIVVCWANLVGAAIPLIAQRLSVDPTVVSGPLITTLVDATGLFIYFTVAHLTISQLSDAPPPSTSIDCIVESRPEGSSDSFKTVAPCDPEHPSSPCFRTDGKAGGFAIAVEGPPAEVRSACPAR